MKKLLNLIFILVSIPVFPQNQNPNLEWEQTYGGTNYEDLYHPIPTSDGGYLLCGSTQSNDGDIQSGNNRGQDYWVVKINSTGTIEWEQTYGDTSYEDLYSIITTKDGGYLLCGSTQLNDGDIQSGNNRGQDYWVVKINSTGTIEWEQTYGGYLPDGLTYSNDGDIQSGNHGEEDCWVVKIDCPDDVNKLSNERIKVYPNPVKDMLFVNLENVQLNVNKILLHNSNGKLVFSSERMEMKSQIIEIPTLKYNTGLYNLNLYTKQGVIQKQILIVR